MRPQIVFEVDGRRVVFALDKDEVLVGRAPTNDLVIDRQYVSRRHARIHRDGESWRVDDLGSKGGTRINDLGHADKVLEHGDRIFLRDFPLTFLARPVPYGDRVQPTLEPGATTVSLTAAADAANAQGFQIYQTAVDFARLASSSPDISRLQRLLALVASSSKAILTSTSLDQTLHSVLDLVFANLPVQRGFIMLWDEIRQDLVTQCVKLEHETGTGSGIQFSRTIAEKVIHEKVAVLTTDAQTDGRFKEGASIIQLGIRSAIAAPIWHGEKVEGLIYADTLRTRAFDKFDLDLLSALGNHVAIAIERSRLQDSVMQQQLVRRRLERYHSPAVIERIAAASSSEDMVAEERDVTVLFADVVEFSTRCESLEPREVAELLNRYFSEMTEVIFAHEGTLDKFIGDCLMAVFGAPLAAPDHPRHAVEAALDMRETLERINRPLAPASRVQFRVGIHSGRAVAGDIGSLRRSEWTVLGATVNLASRLESLVAQPGQIVISETTQAAAGPGYATRCVGEHELKGLSRPVRCYELLGRRPVDSSRTGS